MRDVEGYLTEDNKFFSSPVDAELHEATQALIIIATEHKFSPAAVIQACRQFPHEILRFIHAYYTANPIAQTQGEGDDAIQDGSLEANKSRTLARAAQAASKSLRAEPYDDLGRDREDNGRTKEDTSSIQQLPPSVGQSMPDIRGRIVAEAVRDTGAINGSGGGRVDAPSVRGRPNLAVGTQAEVAKALRDYREAVLRGEAVDEDSQGD